MKAPTLCLRVSRRALGAAAVDNEELAFRDARHLTSRTERAVAAAERYLRRIVELTAPTRVVIDAPHKEGSTSARVLQSIMAILKELGIPAEAVVLTDVLASYGVPGLRSRAELERVVQPFWPDLAAWRGKAKPYVLDAAAVALYDDVRQSLGLPHPA